MNLYLALQEGAHMRAWYPVGRPDADLEDLAAGLYKKGVLVLQPKAGQKG